MNFDENYKDIVILLFGHGNCNLIEQRYATVSSTILLRSWGEPRYNFTDELQMKPLVVMLKIVSGTKLQRHYLYEKKKKNSMLSRVHVSYSNFSNEVAHYAQFRAEQIRMLHSFT